MSEPDDQLYWHRKAETFKMSALCWEIKENLEYLTLRVFKTKGNRQPYNFTLQTETKFEIWIYYGVFIGANNCNFEMLKFQCQWTNWIFCNSRRNICIILWIANANLFPWKELNMKTSCSKSEISVLEMIKNVRI